MFRCWTWFWVAWVGFKLLQVLSFLCKKGTYGWNSICSAGGCEAEREREREAICVCVCEREREKDGVCCLT